jgi:hypothetical protein
VNWIIYRERGTGRLSGKQIFVERLILIPMLWCSLTDDPE